MSLHGRSMTCGNTHKSMRKKKPSHQNLEPKLGLLPHEDNITSLIESHDVDDNNLIEENGTEDYLPDLDNPIASFLEKSEVTLLADIVNELTNVNPTKWANINCADLLPDILQNAENMNRTCTIKDLHAIAKVLELHTGRCWYNTKDRKHTNIIMMVEAFAGKQFLAVEDRHISKSRSVQSLQYLAKECIMKDNYPLICLKAAYPNALLKKHKKIWDAKCRIKLLGYIPSAGEDKEVEHVFEYFSYPEYSALRQQLEFWTMDYTHMLMNMHNHILTHGYDYCLREHYHQLANE